MDTKQKSDTPRLYCSNGETNTWLGKAYCNALSNLLEKNTVFYQSEIYNRTGFLPAVGGKFIRAGESYEKPWTRDASVNCWNAASLLEPDIAANTLWAVCERQRNGKLVIQRDNQWWDQMIWAAGAWSHYLITGDRDFLRNAYETVTESLTTQKKERYNYEYALFTGPAVQADGIAGYPDPPYRQDVGSSFVLDYPDAHHIMALSTNCVYYHAYRCAAFMARELKRPSEEIKGYSEFAQALKSSINNRFWLEEKGLYGYFIHGSGRYKGTLDTSQEGMGLSYAILFGIADEEKARNILHNARVHEKGIVCVWPHFSRFNEQRPGRHNAMAWPVISGMWAHCAALYGNITQFGHEVENLARMANEDNNFYEIVHPATGEPDGGWQIDNGKNRRFMSCPNQTWSATAFLRMFFYGLFGMNFETQGLRLSPMLPEGWGKVELKGLKYRDMALDISLEGAGNRIVGFKLDGGAPGSPFIPCDMAGRHTMQILLKMG